MFKKKRILVVGDFMLDKYIWGTVRRISPEAPVPVVESQSITLSPGGAGNVAANVASLGGEAVAVGVIGDDSQGSQLSLSLGALGVDIRGLAVQRGRITTTKTRVIAQNQQLLRFDKETTIPLSPEDEDNLLKSLSAKIISAEACILSDYAKGFLSTQLCQELIRLATHSGIPVVADPKRARLERYSRATIITPNLKEAEQAVLAINGYPEISPAEVDQIGQVLTRFYRTNFLITRGDNGMSLFQVGHEPVHVRASSREVFDVTGAGDTVVATLAMALANCYSLEEGAKIANAAAGVVVGKVGTATVSISELEEILSEVVE